MAVGCRSDTRRPSLTPPTILRRHRICIPIPRPLHATLRGNRGRRAGAGTRRPCTLLRGSVPWNADHHAGGVGRLVTTPECLSGNPHAAADREGGFMSEQTGGAEEPQPTTATAQPDHVAQGRPPQRPFPAQTTAARHWHRPPSGSAWRRGGGTSRLHLQLLVGTGLNHSHQAKRDLARANRLVRPRRSEYRECVLWQVALASASSRATRGRTH